MPQAPWINTGTQWFAQQNWQPFPFQLEAWAHYLDGGHGLVNAPTGSGKTYALAVPILLEALRAQAEGQVNAGNGLQAIWVTPIRALAKEIQSAISRAAEGLGLDWRVEVRSGDTTASQRQKQKTKPPQVLITTPESLHLLLASKGYPKYFGQLKAVVADEWHELMGSKRGVQLELALSRLKAVSPRLKVWGISATIGNMEEAVAALLGSTLHQGHCRIVRAEIEKAIAIESVLPDEVETFPWAGHLGLKLAHKLVPIIERHGSTLIFTNTRAQCELWYQKLLDIAPELSGAIAMHHGSISRELRDWVETALHESRLKAVVCTSSLDLGVDFRPVEAVVQVGSPKGVAGFMQRAGRSGHQPGALSTIYFLPTHALELIEAAALRQAIAGSVLESRLPYIRSFDVLVQYLVTLAISEGFRPEELYPEVKGTFAYASITEAEWAWCLNFVRSGGQALQAYEDYKKVEVEAGRYVVNSRRVAMRHRMQIGTIVSDAVMQVKYVGGQFIGTIEEWFISQIKPKENFWFAGRSLELVRIKEMTVQVRRSKKKKGKIPAWLGGNLSLSSQLSGVLRSKVAELGLGTGRDPELQCLVPLAEVQRSCSYLPQADELLLEYFKSREGYHLVVYPFEGRAVHEGMGALLAYRISRMLPISFSIAMNDYGFELLSDSEIPIEDALKKGLFTTDGLREDIQASINAAEMAKRKFRDIASISGLVFKGFPGKQKKDRHLQSSSQLFFEVFKDYEPDNLLLLQAYEELLTFQLQEARLRSALVRIQAQRPLLSRPGKATPLAFPIMVDRLRERMSSEKLEDRIRKMKLQLVR